MCSASADRLIALMLTPAGARGQGFGETPRPLDPCCLQVSARGGALWFQVTAGCGTVWWPWVVFPRACGPSSGAGCVERAVNPFPSGGAFVYACASVRVLLHGCTCSRLGLRAPVQTAHTRTRDTIRRARSFLVRRAWTLLLGFNMYCRELQCNPSHFAQCCLPKWATTLSGLHVRSVSVCVVCVRDLSLILCRTRVVVASGLNWS